MQNSFKTETGQKVMHKIFLPWQDEEEERWLESMAKQGWLLTGVGWSTYYFQQSAPGDYVYKLDYVDPKKKERDEYLGLFSDAGWELAAQYFRWYYFRIPANEYASDIYTDNSSKVEKYSRLQKYLVSSFVPIFILLITASNSLINSGSGHPVSIAIIGFLLALELGIAILGVVSITMVSRRIKRLQHD
jgi:hypothetical protein